MQQSLRHWQRKALECYRHALKDQEKSVLWEATPGAGKTTAALLLLSHQLRAGRGEPCLVVVPTAHLKLQWAQAAVRFNIHLSTEMTPFGVGGKKAELEFASRGRPHAASPMIIRHKDFHGAVTTYHQIAQDPMLFRKFCHRSPVILDEIHHAGDGLSWGDALSCALGESRFILCLSGTAFRSDNNPIPFVSYSSEGESQPHFTYGYREAIKDRVCRPVVFFSYGGSISWKEESGDTVSVSLSDPLDHEMASKRLRAALDPGSGWIDPIIKDAHEKLLQVRKEHPDAGGLLVCADKTHARRLAKRLREISGTVPVIVLSDDADASKRIKKYAADSTCWLIACNMVSEGVDIPRLRVGIFATTIRTRMYFRQFLGRIVRRTPEPQGMQLAYCYLPADNRLLSLVEEIENEQRHVISPAADDPYADFRAEYDPDRERKERTMFEASASLNSGVQSVLVSGTPLPLFDGIQTTATFHQIDELIEKEINTKINTELTRSEQKQIFSKQIKDLVSAYRRRTGEPHAAIHGKLNKIQKVKSQQVCSLSQLEERIQLLERLLKNP
jgi:superfamily II DNA or RNA helicase